MGTKTQTEGDREPEHRGLGGQRPLPNYSSLLTHLYHPFGAWELHRVPLGWGGTCWVLRDWGGKGEGGEVSEGTQWTLPRLGGAPPPPPINNCSHLLCCLGREGMGKRSGEHPNPGTPFLSPCHAIFRLREGSGCPPPQAGVSFPPDIVRGQG